MNGPTVGDQVSWAFTAGIRDFGEGVSDRRRNLEEMVARRETLVDVMAAYRLGYELATQYTETSEGVRLLDTYFDIDYPTVTEIAEDLDKLIYGPED